MAKQTDTPSVEDRLRQYVKENTLRPGVKCRTCALGQERLDAIRAVRRDGATLTVITRFLASEGIVIQTSALGHHFNEHEK